MIGDLAGKKVLITGAAGCIGAWVVKHLSENGATPVVFDVSENRNRLDLIMEGAEDVVWEIGDITDFDSLCSVVQRHEIFAIIHLAALQVPFAKADPILGTRVNVMGTAHIFEAARKFGIKRLSFASSIAAPAMGDNDWLPTLYGAHKVCNEQMAAVYWQDWQVPSVCIRPGVIYGPGRDQGMSAAPTTAMLAAFEGLRYNIPFMGSVAFVHASDAAARFIGTVSRETKGAFVFDMQGTEMSICDVLTAIKQTVHGADVTMTGAPLPFPHAPDDGSLDEYIGALPYMSMVDGIKQTLDSFKAARKRGVLTPELAQQLIGKNT